MPTAITQQWLSELLRDAGATHEAVAETLRKAQIKGRRRDPNDCPLARYIASRVREHAPSARVKVTVTGMVHVDIDEPGGYQTIKAENPEPVIEFIQAFDNVEQDYDLYADLVDPSST